MPDIHLPPSMIGQGVYMKSSTPSPAPAPPLINPCNTAITSEVLAFCSSSCDIATTSTPAPLVPPPASGEPRRFAKAPHPTHILKCPRCASLDTKFCYYNNYNLSQPRYFCKNCKRYWTAGGVLRNVPIGGGLRKNKRSKLKLAAEVEAVAVEAARDLCTQQQHHDGKPPNSPVQVASASAMGSSISCANSSVVSGLPVNFTGGTPPSFLPSHTHLPRTSSGSDCSTIDYAGNESCSASAGSGAATLGLMEQQQNSSQLHNFYRGAAAVVGVRPQLYASYGAPASLASSCNQQYSGMSSREEGARSSYIHAAGGYDGSCSQSLISMEDVAGSNRDNGNVSSSHSVMSNMGNGNHGSINKGEKEEIISSNSNYDWQFISENLFNGEGFLGGSSWPDLSQSHAWLKNINT